MTGVEVPSPPAFAALAAPFDLANLPGADRLTTERVTVAGENVRGYCGWHIGPRTADTLVGSGSGRGWLLLPTLAPRFITSVRIRDAVTGALGTPVTGWRVVTGGMLYRPGGWPRGVDNVVVDLEHGFDTCPADLFPALLAIAESIGEISVGVRSRQKSVGDVSRSATYFAESIRAGGTGYPPALAAVLDRYRLPT